MSNNNQNTEKSPRTTPAEEYQPGDIRLAADLRTGKVVIVPRTPPSDK